MKGRFLLWFIIVITLLGVFVDLPKIPVSVNLAGKEFKFRIGQEINVTIFGKNFNANFPLKLGLDLQGGTQLVLQTQMDKIDLKSRDQALESARDVIERRVNLYGVSEALVQSSKVGEERRILVELPGLKDPQQAIDLVGRTAQLDFREFESSSATKEGSISATLDPFSSKPTGLTGADLKQAYVTYGQGTGGRAGPEVAIDFTPQGSDKFAEITRRNVGKPLGMYLDGEPISWPPPTVSQEIIGGKAVITGQFTTDEAKNLAIQLNAGALPVPIKILEQRTIGPTLGEESINKSLVAGIIGLLVLMFYMAFYYGAWGILADTGLLIYTTLVLAIFKTGLFIFPPITLTLAGIAGFILSIGMAVDANILIFERMKEEMRWGKSKIKALELGFERAWSSIWASNVSTLITATILYIFGTSLVRGFAVTLGIGVLVSMFTAVTATRTFLRFLMRSSTSPQV